MKTLQNPRGTTVQSDSFVGAAGQFTIDVERWEIRLHDGETPGGHRILNLQQLLLLFMSKDSEFGDVSFNEGDRGFLTRIGDRQYALRELVAGAGITITEGFGTAGNPTISVGTGLGGMAGSIPSALTTGVAAAFIADLPEGWPESNGAIALLKFHVAPADGATLSVDGADPLPLITADGTNDVNRVLGVGDYGLIVRYANQFILVGLQTPAGTGINPVTGLDADDVQEAIEELTDRVVALEGDEGVDLSNLNRFYKFANLTDDRDAGGSKNILIANGECVLVWGRGVATYTVNSATNLPKSHFMSGEDGPISSFMGIISRIADKIYFSYLYQIDGIGGINPIEADADWTWDANHYYARDRLLFCGNIAPATTTVLVKGTGGGWVEKTDIGVPL